MRGILSRFFQAYLKLSGVLACILAVVFLFLLCTSYLYAFTFLGAGVFLHLTVHLVRIAIDRERTPGEGRVTLAVSAIAFIFLSAVSFYFYFSQSGPPIQPDVNPPAPVIVTHYQAEIVFASPDTFNVIETVVVDARKWLEFGAIRDGTPLPTRDQLENAKDITVTLPKRNLISIEKGFKTHDLYIATLDAQAPEYKGFTVLDKTPLTYLAMRPFTQSIVILRGLPKDSFKHPLYGDGARKTPMDDGTEEVAWTIEGIQLGRGPSFCYIPPSELISATWLKHFVGLRTAWEFFWAALILFVAILLAIGAFKWVAEPTIGAWVKKKVGNWFTRLMTYFARRTLSNQIAKRYQGQIVVNCRERLRMFEFQGPSESKYAVKVELGCNHTYSASATYLAIVREMLELYGLIFQSGLKLSHVTIAVYLHIPCKSFAGELECVLQTTVNSETAESIIWSQIEVLNPKALWGIPTIQHNYFQVGLNLDGGILSAEKEHQRGTL
jgi:hypothetical protein